MIALDRQHLTLLREVLANSLFQDVLAAYAQDVRSEVLLQMEAAHNMQNAQAAAVLVGTLKAAEHLHGALVQFLLRQQRELDK